MSGQKTKQQLLEEVAVLRQRVAVLETSLADHERDCERLQQIEAQWRSDTTRRQRAEEALRESEERFKLFMDNSPAIAWMKDEEWRYVYVNESCARRIGERPEDRIGKTDFELWPQATAELFWTNDRRES